MKTRKVLFSLSAVSLTLYTIWEIIRQIPLLDAWYKEHIWGHPLRVELFWLPYTWLFLGGVLLALIAFLLPTKENLPITKTHKYSTFALAILSLFVTGWALVHSVQVYGMAFFIAPTGLRIIIDLAGCAWLWMLESNPCSHPLPRCLRLFIATGAVLIGLMGILQLASGIAYLTTGHILMFRTHAIGNWLRYLVPTILLCCYSLYMFDKWPSPKPNSLHRLRNSHCAQGSKLERIYPALRIVSFIAMTLAIVSFYCFMIWRNTCALDNYFSIAGVSFGIFLGLSWLVLTFIAFFQLPDPRGYKIYNWISLALNLCFPIGLFLSIYFEGNTQIETFGATLGIIGICSLVSYLLFTSVRVLLYIIPEGNEKRK